MEQTDSPQQTDPQEQADSLRKYHWKTPALEGVEPDEMENGDIPASTIRVGFIGVGGMGRGNVQGSLELPGIEVAAICDVDTHHMDLAVDAVHEQFGLENITRYGDFRELVRADDVDAVVVSTPDHWHVLQGIDAMQCGKDVYIEKPLSLTVEEGRVLCDVEKQTARICQTGTQQRSSLEFRFACELVRNGRLGDIETIQVTIPANNREAPEPCDPMPVPDNFDYDMWLGPAPMREYHEARCHYSFRFISDYSGGQVTNWGTHVLDIAQWALGMDESGPVRVEGRGVFPESGLFDTAAEVDIEWRYANRVRLLCKMGRPRTIFTGSKGSVTVGRGLLEADPPELLQQGLGPGDIRFCHSSNHLGNFYSSVRSRKPPICPAEAGHRTATVCHLGNIAMALKRPLEWDPVAERFVNDDEANGMLSRPMRAPWKLPGT